MKGQPARAEMPLKAPLAAPTLTFKAKGQTEWQRKRTLKTRKAETERSRRAEQKGRQTNHTGRRQRRHEKKETATNDHETNLGTRDNTTLWNNARTNRPPRAQEHWKGSPSMENARTRRERRKGVEIEAQGGKKHQTTSTNLGGRALRINQNWNKTDNL